METGYLLFVLILKFIYITRINAVDHSQLIAMGINCPTLISCDAIDSSDFSRRNCECDRNCVKYQDCCVDARTRLASRNSNSPSFACMPFSNVPNMGAYVIQTCASNYNGPAEIQHGCQDHSNVSDPVMSAPVTDEVTKTSYRNRYCAECNSVDVSNVQSWLIEMVCDFTSNVNANSSFIYQNIYYSSNLNEWRIDIDGRSYTCNLKYDIPAYLLNKVRLCRSNVISTCASTWTRKRVKRECESYTAIVYAGSAVYRNPHCALCNSITVDAMDCSPGASGEMKKPFSFALLLDVNQSDGDIVGVSTPGGVVCGRNQKYDPYFKKCRNLVCLPGYQRVNGKCKKN